MYKLRNFWDDEYALWLHETEKRSPEYNIVYLIQYSAWSAFSFVDVETNKPLDEDFCIEWVDVDDSEE